MESALQCCLESEGYESYGDDTYLSYNAAVCAAQIVYNEYYTDEILSCPASLSSDGDTPTWGVDFVYDQSECVPGDDSYDIYSQRIFILAETGDYYSVAGVTALEICP
jgi:hypothetical protein